MTIFQREEYEDNQYLFRSDEWDSMSYFEQHFALQDAYRENRIRSCRLHSQNAYAWNLVIEEGHAFLECQRCGISFEELSGWEHAEYLNLTIPLANVSIHDEPGGTYESPEYDTVIDLEVDYDQRSTN